MTRKRYARIPEHPRFVKGGEFGTMEGRIVAWIREPAPGHSTLRVAAVWGGRGSGKTSMLQTVLKKLDASAQEIALPQIPDAEKHDTLSNRPDPRLLFDPTKLLESDRVFFSILEFLSRRYWQCFEGHSKKKEFEGIWRDEAERALPKEFRSYYEQIATSSDALANAMKDLFKKQASRTAELRTAIEKLFRAMSNGKERIVLFVDDIDLRPDLGYEILQNLHVFFEHMPLTVLIAADRDLLVQGIDQGFNEKLKTKLGDGSGLGFKLLAKHVHAEWRLPTPTREERSQKILNGPSREDFLQDDESRGDDGAPEREVFRANVFLDWFRRPEKRSDGPPAYYLDDLRRNLSSRRAEGGDGYDDIEDFAAQAGIDSVKELLVDSIPTTWRGVNRLYNSLVGLLELHTDEVSRMREDLGKRYGDRVESAPENVPLFLVTLLALDESFPELGIFEAFEADPRRLQHALSARSARSWLELVGDTGIETMPVRSRLASSTAIDGLTRGRAEPLLKRFGWLWQEIWNLSYTEKNVRPRSFLAISIDNDALNTSKPWWQETFKEGSPGVIDLRPSTSYARLSPEQIREIKPKLEQKIAEYLDIENLRIFALAPLSLMAWLGWHARRSKGLAALSNIPRTSRFDLLRAPVQPPLVEGSLRRLRSVAATQKAQEDVPDSVSPDAAIVLDVRPNPDDSSEGRPFRSDDGRLLRFKHYTKLVSGAGFYLWTDKQVEDIIHDVLHEISRLYADGVRQFHLAFACSSALAILVGQALPAGRQCFLYEDVPGVEAGPLYDFVTKLHDGG